ncbi:MAG: NAD(P)H-binding protein [Deltaproteobacteria bacterium]|nr:NAD(P)H-binding protein [Deltaproteobacteria bacterium]
MTARTKVAIAGASGFVGRALVDALAPRHDVIALARSVPAGRAGGGVTWRACDLFNLRAAERALEGAEVAVYLVHSMLPPAKLTQGRFDDLDLICADNFARAAAAHGVRHIVYLGGLLPRDTSDLSRHLSSRHEVERTLASHGVPVTTLRAGLVIGAGGSSFDMMAKLVKRLPVMLTPRWTSTRSQPIALDDVVPLLQLAVEAPDLAGRAYDIGGPDIVTYAEMLRRTGRALGRRTKVITLPVQTAKLSLLWVSAITGASQSLVRPLVESLGHDMIVTDGGVLQQRSGRKAISLDDALAQAIDDERRAAASAKSSSVSASVPPKRRSPPTVCSIQRLPLGRGRDARWVAEEYMRWLPRFLSPLLHVTVDDANVCRFHLRPLGKPLLELTLAPERSTSQRQLFYVTGGLLAGEAPGLRPRLEFRSVLDGAYVLAAINDFVPRLPWLVYKLTQAIFHLWVMRSFGRHLAKDDGEPRRASWTTG